MLSVLSYNKLLWSFLISDSLHRGVQPWYNTLHEQMLVSTTTASFYIQSPAEDHEMCSQVSVVHYHTNKGIY